MKTYLYLTTLVCLLCSCSVETNTENAQTISIDVNDVNEDFISICHELNITKLDESDVKLGEAHKIYKVDDYTYIADVFKAKKIFMLDQGDSKLQPLIAKYGNSKDEYISIGDFQVDEENRDVYILDASKKMIKRYDRDGQFIENYKFQTHVNNFLVNSDNTIWLDCGNIPSDPSGKSLLLYDANKQKIIDRFHDVDKNMSSIMIAPYTTLYSLDSEVYYFPSRSNTIYAVSKDGVKPKYSFDFGKNWPTESDYNSAVDRNNPMQTVKNLADGGFVHFLNVLDSPEILHLNFMYKDQLLGYFYNKSTNKGQLYNMDGIGRPLCVDEIDRFVFVKYSESGVALIYTTLMGESH